MFSAGFVTTNNNIRPSAEEIEFLNSLDAEEYSEMVETAQRHRRRELLASA